MLLALRMEAEGGTPTSAAASGSWKRRGSRVSPGASMGTQPTDRQLNFSPVSWGPDFWPTEL